MPTNIQEWTDGMKHFPGNTSDLSQVELKGFELALCAHCDKSTKDFSVNGFFRRCEVHFKRSVTTVAKNGSIIPAMETTSFRDLAWSLLPDQPYEDFRDEVEHMATTCLQIKPWLYWFVSWSEFIFKAMSEIRISGCRTRPISRSSSKGTSKGTLQR
ncbi:hypothetical protein K470DRAFT_35433 [Piedraia hortae CBS 480.64]|uniref:Uncharacterized protein n=1 Tax=Piedraia hortae CBS 480.64 TaxID=1314780 RepID=A0A6A7C1N3_9PEZI|nr:hypothetical protein K470DRAFT_35433 [Piedraia hortae CBS 480.64]